MSIAQLIESNERKVLERCKAVRQACEILLKGKMKINYVNVSEKSSIKARSLERDPYK